MSRYLSIFASSFIFAVGLGISGMTRPEKVIGFLDVFGAWDPSLALVMAGAIAVHMAAYRFILRRPTPLLEPTFRIPSRRDLDSRLLGGAALFGLGWGLAGFCPGPGLVAASGGIWQAGVFVVSMLGGMALFHAFDKLRIRRSEPEPA